MATFNITTSQNIDELTSKGGGDTYNINGGTLTIDQDSRYGLNQTTSASWGPVTISATLGGTINVNATAVKLIPYNSGSGNVPASNTVITQSGQTGTGKLIGVWSSLTSAPTAAGAAMPASGFLKLKQVSGTYATSGALTGIGANANGAMTNGWIELVGDEAGLCTLNRLGVMNVTGDWYSLGTTTGANSGTYQLPTSGGNMYCPGVWVETAVSSGVYEFYACAGSLTATSANVATDSVRGKLCWISTSGVVRFQHDGTNSTGGYLPVSGLNIRVPNIFMQNCTTGARTANVLPNATLATRYEFATTGGGVLNMDKANVNWYMNLNQPYSIQLNNVGIMTALVATEMASPITWSQVGIGQEAANTQFALTLNLSFAGGTMTDCVFTRALLSASGNYVATMTDITGFTFTRCVWHGIGGRGNNTTGTVTFTRANSCSFINNTLGGGRFLLTTCSDVLLTDNYYWDRPVGQTNSSNPMYMYDLTASCLRVTMEGISFRGLSFVQPYNGILSIGTGCSVIKLRNLGTYLSPLDLGGPRIDDAAWTRVTTTATVTSVAHGLATNMSVYVVVSSDTGAITVALKTVTATPTADTFQFACTNGGATSGTLCYFPTVSANVFVIASAAAANDVRIQRVYCSHTRTNLFTSDNSSKNLLLESVFSDYLNPVAFAILNCTQKGVSGTPSLAAQTSVYGTHWFDYWNYDNTDDKTAVPWTRSSTTATVTVAGGHSHRTGMGIVVYISSSTAAITLGYKATVTATSSTTFTFTCLNAGNASGTLTYEPLIARIGLMMNEATAETAGQYTIDAGTAAFTSAGGLYMPAVNDQITFICPYYILGYTGFPIAEPVMAGGTLTNYDVTYAIDKNDGSGFGTFKNLSYRRTGAGGSNGASTITMTDTTGVNQGDYVFGTNVGGNAKVVTVDNGTTITVDNPNIGTVSGTLRFNALPNETSLDPERGMKLKIRIKTAATNANAITSFYLFGISTYLSRDTRYTLDPVTVSVTTRSASDSSLISGARVFLEADTGGDLPSGASVTISRSGSTATVAHADHGMVNGQQVVIRGANQPEYNILATIFNVSEDAYDYTVAGSPATPATGTIVASAVIFTGVTDVSGVASGTFAYSGSPQPVKGIARKSTSAPYYKTALISGTITSTGFAGTTFMVGDS